MWEEQAWEQLAKDQRIERNWKCNQLGFPFHIISRFYALINLSQGCHRSYESMGLGEHVLLVNFEGQVIETNNTTLMQVSFGNMTNV